MKTVNSLEHKWRQIIKEHQASGLSVSEYCKQRGFSDVSFYTWRKRLESRRSAKQAKKFVPVVVESNRPIKPIDRSHDVTPEWLARYTLEILKVLRS